MKHFLITACVIIISAAAIAQPGKKPAQQKQPSQADINKMMEEAMKGEGMSKEEQEQMKKMMKDIMPAMQENNATIADYPTFDNNKKLLPPKATAKIAAANAKKALTKTEVSAYATGLYNKLMAKADPAEAALIKKILAQTPKASDLGAATVLAMLQGHPEAALALSMKAVIADPSSLTWQNNMAALLTSYGHPEHAIPILKKLEDDLPLNSTVLNNIGQAWFAMGDADNARRYFTFAYRINPMHPEAAMCGGLMEELIGDPIKATEDYTEAMENSLDPFTEQVLKNHNSNYQPADLDFEKIKKNIAIYEYFPKGWMEIPRLSNDVRNHNEDYATRQAYLDMVAEFTDKIEEMTNTLGSDLDNLAKKGEDEFVKQIAGEAIKGLSFMSKPAVIVLQVLSAYELKWMLAHADSLKAIGEWKEGLRIEKEAEIKKIYKQISDSKKTTCENYKRRLDALENEYMSRVNNRLRDYLVRTTEEYRQWLNAWITWSWYPAGNIKNSVLMQDLGFTAHLAETYSSIVTSMEIMDEHCNSKPSDLKKKIPPPEIPNFTCPAVVSIPAGPEWQQLVAAGKDFNKNSYNMKKTDMPVPNASVAFGTSKMVAQPGFNPSAKTANGSIKPGNADVEAAVDKGLMSALRKVNGRNKEVGDAIDKGLSDALKRTQERRRAAAVSDDELVPLPNIPLDELTPLDPKLLNKYKMTKELIGKMMTADCKNVKTPRQNLKDQLEKMMKKVKELDAYENMMDEIKKLEQQIEQKEADAAKKEAFKKQMERMMEEVNKMDKYEDMKTRQQNIEKIMKEMDAMDDKKAFKESMEKTMRLVNEMESAADALQSIQQGGIQPAISAGVQAPGTFAPIKGLQ